MSLGFLPNRTLLTSSISTSPNTYSGSVLGGTSMSSSFGSVTNTSLGFLPTRTLLPDPIGTNSPTGGNLGDSNPIITGGLFYNPPTDNTGLNQGFLPTRTIQPNSPTDSSAGSVVNNPLAPGASATITGASDADLAGLFPFISQFQAGSSPMTSAASSGASPIANSLKSIPLWIWLVGGGLILLFVMKGRK